MKKHKILHILQNGICEITYKDEFSVEQSAIATLSHTHLPDQSQRMLDAQNATKTILDTIVLFNVPEEEWQTISVQSVIDVEQLTGEGAVNNEKKLQASSEYMEQLELFTEQEFDELERPDDSGIEGSD